MCDSLVKRSDYLTLTPLTYLLVSLEIVARHKVRSDWLVACRRVNITSPAYI
jgi:hypothetical protein